MCFENIPCKATYSVKKGFGTIPRQRGIHSKPQHKCRKLALYSFLEITMRAQDCRKLRAQADLCLCIKRVSFGLILQNIDLFAH